MGLVHPAPAFQVQYSPAVECKPTTYSRYLLGMDRGPHCPAAALIADNQKLIA